MKRKTRPAQPQARDIGPAHNGDATRFVQESGAMTS